MPDENRVETKRRTGSRHAFVVRMEHRCDPAGARLEKMQGPVTVASCTGDPLAKRLHEGKAWISETLDVIKKCPYWKAMPDAAKSDFEKTWKSFEHYWRDLTTRAAAYALWEYHRHGKLDLSQGPRLLAKIASLAAKDQGAGDGYAASKKTPYPYTSDAILVVGRAPQLSAVYETGLLSDEREQVKGDKRALALEVAKATRAALTSTNTWTGATKYVYYTSVADVRNALGVGGVDKNVFGVEGLRAAAGDAGELWDAVCPDERLIAVDMAQALEQQAMLRGWGNCQECSAATSTQLHAGGFVHVEVMGMVGDGTQRGTHAFVVLDRDPLSDPNEPASWGSRALIVESWGMKSIVKDYARADVYPAAQGRKNLPGEGEIHSHFRLPDP